MHIKYLTNLLLCTRTERAGKAMAASWQHGWMDISQLMQEEKAIKRLLSLHSFFRKQLLWLKIITHAPATTQHLGFEFDQRILSLAIQCWCHWDSSHAISSWYCRGSTKLSLTGLWKCSHYHQDDANQIGSFQARQCWLDHSSPKIP